MEAVPADLAGAGLGLLKWIERVVTARETVDLDVVWKKIEKQGIKAVVIIVAGETSGALSTSEFAA